MNKETVRFIKCAFLGIGCLSYMVVMLYFFSLGMDTGWAVPIIVAFLQFGTILGTMFYVGGFFRKK